MKNLLKYIKDFTLHPKNAAELKGLILQLAVQGKLTTSWRLENPDVEPASVLLKKIQEEKVQLIKEKKARQERLKKEFAIFSTEFALPETWISTNLTEVYYTIGSKQNQIKANQYLDQGKYPIVSQGKKLIDGYSNDVNKIIKIEKSVVVFGDHTRIVKLVDFDFIIGADGTKILVPFTDVISDFFYIFLSSIDLSNRGYARHYSHLKNEPFALPPLEEQKAIVSTVNTLFAEVEQLEALTKERIQLKEAFVTSALQKLTNSQSINGEWAFLQQHFPTFFTELPNIKKLRESILQLAVQGKLTTHWRKAYPDTEDSSVLLERIKAEKTRLVKEKKVKKEKPLSAISEDEMPYELPEGWVWCKFGEIVSSMNNGLYKPSKFYTDQGVISLRMYNIQNGKINFDGVRRVEITEEEYDRYELEPNDLLINRVNSAELIGKTAIIPDYKERLVYESMNIRTKIIFKNEMASFVNICFLSKYVRDYLMSNAKHAIGQSSINQTIISSLNFPLPSVEEQKAIVEKVNSLMALCDQLEQEIQSSKTTQEDWMKSSLREVFAPETKTKELEAGELGMVAEPKAKY